jgi:ferredoxin
VTIDDRDVADAEDAVRLCPRTALTVLRRRDG